ncbi:MAG: 5'-nucleotidase, lipoprotein e(P4) family [Gemmatimonadales bacterium]
MKGYGGIRWIILLATAGCGGHHPLPPSPTPNAGASATADDRNDIRWFRASAEYRGIAIEVYRAAAARLPELTRDLDRGKWAVILDADETVLDNSLNERRLADRHATFSEAEWTTWVRERAATAIPGAVDFTRRVHALGGRIAIVTNRADSLCQPTRENLRGVGIDADVVLCQPGSESDKNPRFRRVQQGTAASGIPALTVVEWLGDNIQDFPDLSQAIRSDNANYHDFGVRYFLLPNPMYGSWTHNPEP